ncbi:hypothetical protein ScPMuIL_008355, partial [Solemya velum]
QQNLLFPQNLLRIKALLLTLLHLLKSPPSRPLHLNGGPGSQCQIGRRRDQMILSSCSLMESDDLSSSFDSLSSSKHKQSPHKPDLIILDDIMEVSVNSSPKQQLFFWLSFGAFQPPER